MITCSRCGGNHMRVECKLGPLVSVGKLEPVMRVTADEQTKLCNQIWNDAIEAAAKIVDENVSGGNINGLIRKLKK